MRRTPSSIALFAALSAAACSSSLSYRESAEQAAQSLEQSWLEEPLQRLTSDEMEGRDNLTAGGFKARRYLVEQLEASGLAPRGPSEWEQPFDQGVNVLAEIRGRDANAADEYVLLCAHYDHLGRCGKAGELCPGATDNAAGVTAVLAVARALAASDAGTRRSILVALWDAEEDGLLGSRLYVGQQPVVPLSQIAAVVNIDAVGATLIPGVQSSFALGVEYATDDLRELIKANNEASSYVMFPVSSYFDGSTEEGGGRSDHLPFREKEIPAVWYSSGAPSEYHTPADKPSIVDLPKLLGTARHALLVTADLANNDQPPGYAPRKPNLDDARALIAIGEVVLADPAAAGFGTSADLITVLEQWLQRLRRHVATPPTTDAEWEAYDAFVRSILATVFALLSTG